jgi:hypothetical protein
MAMAMAVTMRYAHRASWPGDLDFFLPLATQATPTPTPTPGLLLLLLSDVQY